VVFHAIPSGRSFEAAQIINEPLTLYLNPPRKSAEVLYLNLPRKPVEVLHKLVLAGWRTELWVREKGDGQLTVDQVEIYMLGVDGYDIYIYIYILGTIYGNI
jgi:hypothetical protein